MSINPNQAIICPQQCGQYVFANLSKQGKPYYTQSIKQPQGKPDFHQCPNYQPEQAEAVGYANPTIGSSQSLPANPFPIQAQPLQAPAPQGLQNFMNPAPPGVETLGTQVPQAPPQPESQPVQEGWNELIHGSLKTISLHLADIKSVLISFKEDNKAGYEMLTKEFIDLGVTGEDWENLFTKVAELATGKTKEIKNKKT